MVVSELIRRWFPRAVEPEEWRSGLEAFYRARVDYYEMLAQGDPGARPQVALLLCLVRSGGTYAEIGCGTGSVAACVGRVARVHGFDVSPQAIAKARSVCAHSEVNLACSGAERLPLEDGSVDGCYAFEVLEHVWDPVAVVGEMVRVVRPGGFVLISAPLPLSLDLHLKKRGSVRRLEIALAAIRRAGDRLSGRAFVNLAPCLTGAVYPDCDLVSALIPAPFACAVEGMGCRVDFWDTTYMCAHRQGSVTDLAFQRNARHPFYRHFGDHLLMLATKR
jgi:SAM-dependent methyltransferase